MRYCKHTQWLGLAVNDEDVILQNSDRLPTLLEDLPNPDEQSPSLLVFIGNRSKAMAIKELAKTFSPPPKYGHDPSCQSRHDDETTSRGQTKLSGRRAHGEIHLHIHDQSVFSNRPVLLAEGDLPSLDKSKPALATDKCHETASRQLNSRAMITPNLSESADKIYFRLLSPFTDVFCFFADDVGSFGPIVKRLASWLDLGQPSTLPRSTRAKILIVTERAEDVPGDDESDLKVFNRILRDETTMDVSEQFSEIRILGLSRKKSLSNKARHRELFETLLNFSDQVREARINTRTLFSARHFAAFFGCALNHMEVTSVEPFDFITASRIKNPVPSNLVDHLEDFLRNIKTPQKLLAFALPVIASSFLLDSYPPDIDVHFFSPAEVFHTLYREVCHQVCQTGVLVHEGSTHIILPSSFVRLLEVEFVDQVDAFARSNMSSATWRRARLSEFKDEWATIHSFKSCYVCGMRTPQYNLRCRHVICDDCVQRFGTKADIWKFEADKCFLCGLDTLGFRITIKPPTATIKLLSMDGGGARGVITLIILQVLAEKLGLPHPFQNNFDFVYGTSSGGIIDLALCVNGWTVEDCIDSFERMAKLAFKKKEHSYFRWVFQIRAILISLFTDGIYPAHKLELLLREVFGSSTGILDYSNATASGTKIGIPVSSMKPEPFIFTNYNGIGYREDNKKYGILLGNTKVWEIARSTSAAPGLFTTKSIVGQGKFQDGGLQYNDPTALALEEIKALFPDDPSAKRSTLIVSLGTGKSPDVDHEMYGSNSWWGDLWLVRLCRLFRALWSSTDSQERSDAIQRKELNKLRGGKKRRRGEYFRFNVEFSGREPRLDDATKMPEMKILARETILCSKQADRLVHCLIAENFVFELESNPRKENGVYPCIGYILCRLRVGNPALEDLLAKLAKSSAKFLLRGRALPGAIRDRSSLARDGNFRKRVRFDVKSKEDLVSLQLREEDSESYNISGSPFSVDWLVERQGLGEPFRRLDHMNRKRKNGDEGGSRKRQRL